MSAAELVAIEYNGTIHALCYTSNSKLAPLLFDTMQEFRFDHSEYKVVFLRDFNAHNPGWIPSETKEDKAGRSAQAFSEMFGIR